MAAHTPTRTLVSQVTTTDGTSLVAGGQAWRVPQEQLANLIAWSQPQTFSFTSAGSFQWTPPLYAVSFDFLLVGGGGAGAITQTDLEPTGAGGGGSGEVVQYTGVPRLALGGALPTDVLPSLTVTVGAAGSAAGATGAAGSDSSISDFLVARGGGGADGPTGGAGANQDNSGDIYGGGGLAFSGFETPEQGIRATEAEQHLQL